MEEIKRNILYVDDEAEALNSFRALFRRYYNIFTANSVKEAKEILEQNEIAVLLTDQKMPFEFGTDLLQYAAAKFPNQLRILVSGYANLDEITLAINKGHIFNFIQKPWNNDELKMSIDGAVILYNKVMHLEQEQNTWREKLREYEEQIKKLSQKTKEGLI